jgi:hypothetical protein
MREQQFFFRLIVDGNDQLIEQRKRARGDVEMAVVERVEGAGVKGCGHALVNSQQN